MSETYTLTTGTNHQRAAVSDWLWGLDRVSPRVREGIVTAWVTSWASSSYESLEEMVFQPASPSYPLGHHVNEVTRAGVDLANRAMADWGVTLDWDVMLSILILHDVDKPLLYTPTGHTALYRELPHGVVGAMLLKELGFPHRVVSTVATHATNAPFHTANLEAHVLHYADLFAADHALRSTGKVPFYLRK